MGGTELQYSCTHAVLGCAPFQGLQAKVGQVFITPDLGLILQTLMIILVFPVLICTVSCINLYSNAVFSSCVFVPPEQYLSGKKPSLNHPLHFKLLSLNKLQDL